MNKIKQILIISITLISLLTGIIIYQIKTYIPENLTCATSVPFCGTLNLNLTDNQNKGKEIFNSNCAACHKKNARSAGPVLGETDSLVFTKWLIQDKHKIDSTKIEKLQIDYHRMMFSHNLSKKEIVNLIDYCKSK